MEVSGSLAGKLWYNERNLVETFVLYPFKSPQNIGVTFYFSPRFSYSYSIDFGLMGC
jgi:hypothetical protein